MLQWFHLGIDISAFGDPLNYGQWHHIRNGTPCMAFFLLSSMLSTHLPVIQDDSPLKYEWVHATPRKVVKSDIVSPSVLSHGKQNHRRAKPSDSFPSRNKPFGTSAMWEEALQRRISAESLIKAGDKFSQANKIGMMTARGNQSTEVNKQ
nr:hypothetical protein CFP56_20353 [Quercus suber]